MSAPRDVLFRETFLARLPDPEERETMQRFGSMVLSWAVGAEHSAEGRDTPTASEIAPVAADLRHLAVYLRTVVDEVEGSVVETRESYLAHLATGWARRVDALAQEVEAALDAAETGGAP